MLTDVILKQALLFVPYFMVFVSYCTDMTGYDDIIESYQKKINKKFKIEVRQIYEVGKSMQKREKIHYKFKKLFIIPILVVFIALFLFPSSIEFYAMKICILLLYTIISIVYVFYSFARKSVKIIILSFGILFIMISLLL